MYELPVTITINDAVYHIRNDGDYRTIIDCFNALQDEELDDQFRIYTALFIFYDSFENINEIINCVDVEQLITKMFWFFNCGEPEYPSDSKSDYRLIDWDADSQLVASAINHAANMEIRSIPYIHWWTFMGYYNAVGECTLSLVVSIRKKVVEGKKLEKYEREFKRDNPRYFHTDLRNTQQRKFENQIKNLWNSDK